MSIVWFFSPIRTTVVSTISSRLKSPGKVFHKNPLQCRREKPASLRNDSIFKLGVNTFLFSPWDRISKLLAHSLVNPRRNYIDCVGGWIVFYIWINCQCLEIIRFHCFPWKTWQLSQCPHIETICWSWVGLLLLTGACAILHPAVTTTPEALFFNEAQCHHPYSISELGRFIICFLG